MKLPKLPAYTIKGSTGTGDYFSGHTDESLKRYALKVQQLALDAALEAAIDACGFNGASIQLQAQIRVAIMDLLINKEIIE